MNEIRNETSRCFPFLSKKKKKLLLGKIYAEAMV